MQTVDPAESAYLPLAQDVHDATGGVKACVEMVCNSEIGQWVFPAHSKTNLTAIADTQSHENVASVPAAAQLVMSYVLPTASIAELPAVPVTPLTRFQVVGELP
jgi:hypothetical protein